MSPQLNKGKILFVSSMPVSRSNAIGIQISHFAKCFASEWNHCYWDISMGKSDVPNSFPLNSPIPYLWPFELGRGFLTRQIERFALSWWQGDSLIDSRKPRLLEILGDVRLAHVAPLRNREASRCREILETVGCPFVVQIWDISDPVLNEDYDWLFSRAARVFCLSSNMMEEVRQNTACETSIQSFVRPPSTFRARYIGEDKLIIGLEGFFLPTLTAFNCSTIQSMTCVCNTRMSASSILGRPGS